MADGLFDILGISGGLSATAVDPGTSSSSPSSGQAGTGYQFIVVHRDRSGTIKNSAIGDYLKLDYIIYYNQPGRLNIDMKHDHRALDDFENFDQVEIWWRNPVLGVGWHADFWALYREPEEQTDLDKIEITTLKCPGQMEILSYRHIAYAAGTPNKTEFSNVAAETIIKNLINQNCTSIATTGNGRIRDGDLGNGMGFTIKATTDQSRGSTLDRSFAESQVLKTIIDNVLPVAGGDLVFTKTGMAEWEVDFKTPHLGEDKSSGQNRVLFSLDAGNLLNPKNTILRLHEKTVAIVGGAGKGEERTYQEVKSSGWSADNDIETFVSATNETTAAGLTAVGDAILDQVRATQSIQYDTLQTKQTFYTRETVAGSKTYQVGDLILVYHKGTAYVQKIVSVQVTVEPFADSDQVQFKIGTQDISS